MSADSAAAASERVEHRLLVRGEGTLRVSGVGDQGRGGFGAVEHGQVGALSGERGHQVRRRPADGDALRVLARYVLEIPDLAGMRPVPRRALDVAFDHLGRGWPGV